MSNKPITQFGRREAALAVQRDRPTKRSSHVALLLAGTVAVGGGAYALMPGENCAPNQPGMAAPANAGCSPRSSSSGGGSSRYGFYSGDSTANKSASGTSPSGSGTANVTRGGFGSFAHAFTSHFSGGG
ncbi:MAG: hypothetical protein QOJ86_3387 [Bradyrhizobium sp.]|jgi:hypothetical protein|nr:hypothetical protein [Bradyrhizobium sp.]